MIQNKFDMALKLSRGGKQDSFYSSERVRANRYYAYYTKGEWDSFVKEMSPEVAKAYNDGGGKELDENYKNGSWTPPKMASYASSSRFVYELLKEKSVILEQKLPTSVPRATSNMDAYLPGLNMFVEAKCHEIYSNPSPKYKLAYKEFYDIIASRTGFLYLPDEEKNDSPIRFSINGEFIERFDIKQTIAHILGIANAFKNGIVVKGEKKLLDPSISPVFIYLVFNPIEVREYLDKQDWDIIQSMYEEEIAFIKEHMSFFKELFRLSLEYVGYDANKLSELANSFEVKLADQFTIKQLIG